MSKILFLFEGKKYEPNVFKTTIPIIAPDSNFIENGNGIVCEYGTHIYNLYSKLKEDDGLDLIGLLIEESDKYPQLQKAVEESGYPQDTFEAIYLLFDYDGHVNMPRMDDGSHLDGDSVLLEMLTFFDNATHNGKLLISYPMVEAIKHLKEEPKTREELVTTKCKGPHCPNFECEDRTDRDKCPPIRRFYKSFVNEVNPHWSNIENIKSHEWSNIFKYHLKTAELLCNLPLNEASQIRIFNEQKNHFINMTCPKVVVLSSLPFLFVDLLGVQTFQNRLVELKE